MINLRCGNVVKKLLTLSMAFFIVLMLGGCDRESEYKSDKQLIEPPASQSKSLKEFPASQTQEKDSGNYKKDHQLGVKIPLHPDLPEETSPNSE